MFKFLSSCGRQLNKIDRILTKRALGQNEICSPTLGYVPYFRQSGGGGCFGASLYWVSNVLKKSRKSALPFKVQKSASGKYVGNTISTDFYNLSLNLQDAYVFIFDKEKSVDAVINLLNDQERRLYKYLKKSEPLLRYKRVMVDRTIEVVEQMLLKNIRYQNSAIILSTSLEKMTARGNKGHVSVLLYYANDLYFFDVNCGVYYIAEPENLHWSSLVLTIAKNMGIGDSEDNKYQLDDESNIFIRITA
ncbi:hypothetical protein [Enterobacter sp. Bisph1]|uniref:hypothetical protein n=1 Tax=Enterobacter sp. Bisph1 TaxID=1274399 RepID=UPI00057C04C5|nr:hypothetical protein [Enterobacter sp. Bisph1]